MILNLFRVEKISVEGMMSHSFKERAHCDKQKQYAEELESVKKKMEEISLNTQQHGPHWKPLSDFYDNAKKYLKLRSAVTVCCFVYILYVHNSFQFLKYIVRTLN
jgi:superfamily II RNA helicase